MEYGLQLYSVRDFTEKNLAFTLEQVAKIGYKYMEFAGFFGHSAEEVKAMLKDYGLIAIGTHSGFTDLESNFTETVKYLHTIGSTNYIIPGASWQTAAELDATIAKLNKFQPMLATEGITLAYHNHHGEFLPNADGQIPHEEMEKRTLVQFEIDTYWAYVAGKDPVEVITRLQDRVKMIHLKDGLQNGEEFALGEGNAPVAAVYDKAKELGIQMVVESETLKPDGISEVTRCFEYLKKLG